MICLLLSHVCCNHGDGNLERIEQALIHSSEAFPLAKVILTGHGSVPHYEIKERLHEFCDHIIWTKTIVNEVGMGHPKCVHVGLQVAKFMGATHVLKIRADSIIKRDDIFEYCQFVLEEENMQCLVTAQTTPHHNLIGDLFMYGEVDFLLSIWQPNKWVNEGDGMKNLWRIYHQQYNNLRSSFSYRDCETLQWYLLTEDGEMLWDKKYWAYITKDQYYAS